MGERNDDDLIGSWLGEYRVLELIGTGGFGAVYRAEQPLLEREVALKVLRHRDRARDRRLVREAKLASKVKHELAAKVHQLGIEEDGRVWIAMELVPGMSLDRWLNLHGPMPLYEFVPLFSTIADVVHAAHSARVVHRDLKPSNVMVTDRDGRLVPTLLDFGVATLIDKHDPGNSGSPPYMAPECWQRERDAGPAADLYALAVIAYEALTGRLPFVAAAPAGEQSTAAAWAEAHGGPIPPVGPGMPSELDRFFEHALAKRPEDRFQTARDLAAGLGMVLDSRMLTRVRAAAQAWHSRGRRVELLWRGSVLAELEEWLRAPSSALDLAELEFIEASTALGKAVATAELEARRHRRARFRLAIAGIACAAGAAVLGAVQLYQVARARGAQLAAETTTELEQGRAALLHGELAEAQPHLWAAYHAGDESPATEFMLSRAIDPLLAERARFAAATGRMWSSNWSPDGRHVVTSDDAGAAIWDVGRRELEHRLVAGGMVYSAIYAGDEVIAACDDGAVRVWDAPTGALRRELRADRKDGKASHYFAVAAVGQLIAASDTLGEVAQVWSRVTGALLAELPLDGAGWHVLAFSPDGRWLAAGGGDRLDVFDTSTWDVAARLPGPQIRAAAWSPNGARILTGSADGDASIWEIPAGTRARHLHEIGEPVDAAAWSPDGRLVAIGVRDGGEQVFDVSAGRAVSTANLVHDKLTAIEFGPASQRLVAASANGTVAISDVATGLPVRVLAGPAQLVRTVHFAPDGDLVLGASWDGTARIWDAREPYRRWDAPAVAADCDVGTSLVPDSRFVAIPCRQHPVRVWDTARNELLAELPPVQAPGGDYETPFPAVSHDGTRAAIARGRVVEVYELPGVGIVHRIEHGAPVSAVALGPTGAVVSGDTAGAVRVTARDGSTVEAAGAGAGIDAVALLADGRVLAADARGMLRVLARRGRGLEVVAAAPAPARIGLLRPSPDGDRLVTIPPPRSAGRAVLWDLATGQKTAELQEHRGRVLSARWVDGGRVLTTGLDGTARLWDGATAALIQTFHGSGRYLADVVLSADGALVVGGGADGLLRFWDAKTGRAVWTTPAYKSPLVGVHLDGEAVITRGFGGEITRWLLPRSKSVIDACRGCDIVTP